MQIVINLSEENYKSCLTTEYIRKVIYCDLVSAIRKGTILPKGHGRLIDADMFISNHFGNVARLVDEAPTIIDADNKEMCDGEK